MVRPLLIVNPTSGSARTGRNFPSILTTIESRLGDVDIVYTARQGHAVELAQRGVAEGHDLIIAVGGDGTLSEVANGVLRAQNRWTAKDPGTDPTSTSNSEPRVDRSEPRVGLVASQVSRSEPRVGLIAMGTGGDFRRSLGLEHQLSAYLAALTSGHVRRVDVGKATFVDKDGATVNHYFSNVLSAGLGGLVDRYVSQSPPFIGGRSAYYIASLRALLTCQRRPLHLRMWVPRSDVGDGYALADDRVGGGDTGGGETAAARSVAAASPVLIERQVEAWIIAVCNGSWFGAGMHVCPPALPDDGLLDVVIVTVPTKAEFVRKLPSVYRGEHLAIAGVEHIRCTRIQMELTDAGVAAHDGNARKPYLLDVDGEPLGRLPLVVEIVPQALQLCV